MEMAPKSPPYPFTKKIEEKYVLVSSSSLTRELRERYRWLADSRNRRTFECPYCRRTGTLKIRSQVLKVESIHVLKNGEREKGNVHHYAHLVCSAKHAAEKQADGLSTRLMMSNLDANAWKLIGKCYYYKQQELLGYC